MCECICNLFGNTYTHKNWLMVLLLLVTQCYSLMGMFLLSQLFLFQVVLMVSLWMECVFVVFVKLLSTQLAISFDTARYSFYIFLYAENIDHVLNINIFIQNWYLAHFIKAFKFYIYSLYYILFMHHNTKKTWNKL